MLDYKQENNVERICDITHELIATYGLEEIKKLNSESTNKYHTLFYKLCEILDLSNEIIDIEIKSYS